MSLNFRLLCLGFLIMLVNFKIATSFKCEFFNSPGPRKGHRGYYTCGLKPDSSGFTESHISDWNDNEIKKVSFQEPWLNTLPVSLSEYPFCDRFNNLELVEIHHAMSVDENLLQHCDKLSSIKIFFGDVAQIPENLFSKNTKITELNLEQNKLTTLPENVFQNQKALKELNLALNRINSLPGNVFKPLQSLQKLDLGSNQIRALNSAWFESFGNLESLDFRYNKLSDLPKNIFSHLANLNNLMLYGNQLTFIHSDSFGIHTQLEYINLHKNRITAFDEKIIDNAAVYTLDMEENVCSQERITRRDQMKQKLRICFENYHLRQ